MTSCHFLWLPRFLLFSRCLFSQKVTPVLKSFIYIVTLRRCLAAPEPRQSHLTPFNPFQARVACYRVYQSFLVLILQVRVLNGSSHSGQRQVFPEVLPLRAPSSKCLPLRSPPNSPQLSPNSCPAEHLHLSPKVTSVVRPPAASQSVSFKGLTLGNYVYLLFFTFFSPIILYISGRPGIVLFLPVLAGAGTACAHRGAFVHECINFWGQKIYWFILCSFATIKNMASHSENTTVRSPLVFSVPIYP